MPDDLLDLVSLSVTLPPQTRPDIGREGVLQTIDELFAAGYSGIVVSGNVGTGKTTLLRHYVERNRHDAVNFFLDPNSTYIGSYELVVQELTRQLAFVKGEPHDIQEVHDASVIRELLPAVAQMRRLQKRPLTIVVDGIFDLDPPQPALVSQILSLFPTSFNSIRFLFSVETENLATCESYWKNLYVQSMPPMTTDEVTSMLNPAYRDDDFVREVKAATNGNPGQIASVSRLLTEGVTFAEIKAAGPRELRQYYELEWNKAKLNDYKDYLALSAIVFLPATFTLELVAEIVGADQDDLSDTLASFSFVKLISTESGITASIESHPFRQFLNDKLECYRDRVIEAAISVFRNDKEAEDTVDVLPVLLELKGANKELADYLTPEIISVKLKKSRSLLAVSEMLQKGLAATREQKSFSDSLFFSLLSSTLLDLLDNPAITRQVEYLSAQGDHATALTFARSIFSVESRLLALAKVAKEIGRSDNDIGYELHQELAEHVDSIAASVPEERALDIASELVCCDKPLAVELLSGVAKRSGSDNSFDWLVTKLAQRTLDKSDTDAYEKVYDSFTNDISDDIRTGLSAVRNLFRTTQDARQLIKQIKEITSTEKKVFLGRAYLRSSAEGHAKIELAYAVMEDIVGDPEYLPNASTYADLTQCLADERPVSTTAHELSRLVTDHLVQIKERGPTADYYKVKFNLLEYQFGASNKTTPDDVLDLLYEIESQRLYPDIQIICLVRLAGLIERIWLSGDDAEQLTSLSRSKVDECVDQIVNNLADQDAAILPAAYSEFKNDSDEFFAIMRRVNTEPRRDSLAKSCLENAAADVDYKHVTVRSLKFWRRAIDSIQNYRVRGSAAAVIGRSLCQSLRDSGFCGSSDADDRINAVAEFLVGSVEAQTHPAEAVLHAADVLNAFEVCNLGFGGSRKARVISVIEARLPSLDALDGTASILIDVARYPSPEIDAITESHFHGITADEVFRRSSLTGPMRQLCNLAVRALPDLLEADQASYERTLSEIAGYIGSLPSKIDQCREWAHLACLVMRRRLDVAESITQIYLWPLYASIKEQDIKGGQVALNAMIVVAPALWTTHRSAFNDEVECFDSRDRDRIYMALIRFLTKGGMPGEPVAPEGHWQELRYDGVMSCIEILERVVSDWAVWAIVRNLLEVDRRSKSLRRLAGGQRQTVIRKITEVVSEKLPSPTGVSHEGYAVLTKIAVTTRITGQKITEHHLEETIDRIGNVSDCAYIYAELIAVLPSKYKSLREFCVRKAVEGIEAIPSVGERLERAVVFLRAASADFQKTAREKTYDWFQRSTGNDSEKVLANQREIVDMAYRYDAEWGESLASFAEQPNTNAKTKSMLEGERRNHEAEESVRSNNWDGVSEEGVRRYADVFWRALGTVNSDGYSTLENCGWSKSLEEASRRELDSIFPVYAFSCTARFGRVPVDNRASQSMDMLASVKGAIHILTAAIEGPVQRRWTVSAEFRERTETEFWFVDPDGRENAFRYMYEWLASRSPDRLVVVDPYFELDQIDVCRFGQQSNPHIEITIVGGSGLVSEYFAGEKIPERFQATWAERYQADRPPECTLVLPYFAADKSSPLHDRWLLTDDSGLKLGTSLNGMGGNKESSLSMLRYEEFLATHEKINAYVQQRKKQKRGYSVRYIVLPLS